jgi:hypothetical protein
MEAAGDFSIDANLSAIELINAKAASMRSLQGVNARAIGMQVNPGRVSLQADDQHEFRYKTYHCVIAASPSPGRSSAYRGSRELV